MCFNHRIIPNTPSLLEVNPWHISMPFLRFTPAAAINITSVLQVQYTHHTAGQRVHDRKCSHRDTDTSSLNLASLNKVKPHSLVKSRSAGEDIGFLPSGLFSAQAESMKLRQADLYTSLSKCLSADLLGCLPAHAFCLYLEKLSLLATPTATGNRGSGRCTGSRCGIMDGTGISA